MSVFLTLGMVILLYQFFILISLLVSFQFSMLVSLLVPFQFSMLVSLLVPFQFSMRISLPVPFPFYVLSLALNRKVVKQSTTTRIIFKPSNGRKLESRVWEHFVHEAADVKKSMLCSHHCWQGRWKPRVWHANCRNRASVHLERRVFLTVNRKYAKSHWFAA